MLFIELKHYGPQVIPTLMEHIQAIPHYCNKPLFPV